MKYPSIPEAMLTPKSHQEPEQGMDFFQLFTKSPPAGPENSRNQLDG